MNIEIERVYKDKGKFIAVSKDSPFYPDGKGGQLGDRGKIGNRNVLRVFEKDGMIHHLLDGEIEPGEYEAWIDENRRKEIARQHTAQHILSAAFVRVADIETVSFHMGEDFSTIDLNAAPILEEVMDEVEELANIVVLENRKVIEHVVERDEANEFPLRKPISDKVKGKVRIIEVEGFDWSACGGFHVSRTGEIGIVKIIDYEKVKGSLTRVYFVAGMRALKEFSKRVKVIWNLSKALTTSVDEMEARIGNIVEMAKEKSAKLDKLAEEFAEKISEELVKNSEKVNDILLISYDGYKEVGKYLFKFLGDREDSILVIKVDGGYEIGSRRVNVSNLIKKLNQSLGGRGG
jgi:alanyl-tRNA synthetase